VDIGADFSSVSVVERQVSVRGRGVLSHKARDVMQRFFGVLILNGHVQVEEFTASMSHAADLCDAQIKTRLLIGEVVADQLVVPVVQEGSGVFAGAAPAEVVNDCQYDELNGRKRRFGGSAWRLAPAPVPAFHRRGSRHARALLHSAHPPVAGNARRNHRISCIPLIFNL
jgi:hypothetical protein